MTGALLGPRGGGGGGAAGAVSLADDSVFGATWAFWYIYNTGWTWKRDTSAPAVIAASWINPQSGMAGYEVKASVNSGHIPTGSALNAWLDFSSNRGWGWTNQVGPGKEVVLLVEIRNAATLVVVDTALITIGTAGTL